MRRARKTALALGVFTALMAVAILVLPWRIIATDLLVRALARRGIVAESITLKHWSLDGAEFTDLRFRQPAVLRVDSLTLGFSRPALLRRDWTGAVTRVAVRGVQLAFESADGTHWLLNGQALPTDAKPNDSGPLSAIKTVVGALTVFPGVDFEDVRASVHAPGLDLTAPLTLTSRFDTTGLATEVSVGALEGVAGGWNLATAPARVALNADTKSHDVALSLTAPEVRLRRGTTDLRLPLRAEVRLPSAAPAHATATVAPLTATVGSLSLNAPQAAFDVALAPSGPGWTLRGTAPGLTLKSGNLTAQLPLELQVRVDAKRSLEATIARGAVRHGALTAEVATTQLHLIPEGGTWLPARATLRLSKAVLGGVPDFLRTLGATADCRLTLSQADCTKLTATVPMGEARGAVRLPYATPNRLRWSLNGQGRAMGGRVRFTGRPVHGAGVAPAAVELRAERLDLAQLLAAFAAGKASGEGSVSGRVPLTWMGGNRLTFGEGLLRADAPGVLRLAPNLLAMDNPTVASVSGVLADFRFSDLSIALGSDAGGALKARLSTLGHNPDQWNGRPVKLNVNLGGDLLSLIQQSLLPMSDPRQWIPPASSPPASSR